LTRIVRHAISCETETLGDRRIRQTRHPQLANLLTLARAGVATARLVGELRQSMRRPDNDVMNNHSRQGELRGDRGDRQTALRHREDPRIAGLSALRFIGDRDPGFAQRPPDHVAVEGEAFSDRIARFALAVPRGNRGTLLGGEGDPPGVPIRIIRAACGPLRTPYPVLYSVWTDHQSARNGDLGLTGNTERADLGALLCRYLALAPAGRFIGRQVAPDHPPIHPEAHCDFADRAALPTQC
jgi:hypothetical protein